MRTSFIIIMFTLILSSCSKFSDNGALDGKWRLYEMYTKPHAESSQYITTELTDRKSAVIYCNIQLRLIAISSGEKVNGYTHNTVARFNYNGTSLQVGPVYIHYRDRDSLLTDPTNTSLVPLGIRGNATDYNIKQLNSATMVLCSRHDSLIFHKLH